MDQQTMESFGWLLLMLFTPLLALIRRITEKNKSSNLIITLYSIIAIFSIIFIYVKANYPLPLSIFIGLLLFISSYSSTILYYLMKGDSKRRITPYIPLFIFPFVFGFTIFLTGFFMNNYIFIISGFIWVPISVFGYFHYTYFGEKYHNEKVDEQIVKGFITIGMKIPFISILFIAESFGLTNIFGVIDATSFHWLFSTIAQVFSALLGIIVMLGIFILTLRGGENVKHILTDALKGFSILFIVVIFISIIGIIFVHEGDFENNYASTNLDLRLNTLIPPIPLEDRNLPNLNQIFYSGLFTVTLIMVIGSLQYLYELIQIMFDFGKERQK